MAALPAPPRTDTGELAAGRYDVMGQMVDGLTGACCVCGQSGIWWWRQECTYYPLHITCIGRLIEHWSEMIAAGTDQSMAGTPLRGAYARRAAARGAATVVRPLSVDGGSPYFRPGMPDGAPWTVCLLTVAGVSIMPWGLDAERASRTCDVRQAAWRNGLPSDPGKPLVVGGCVVGPDGAVSREWGLAPIPGESLPWEPLMRASAWGTCRVCDDRVWPGRWVGTASGGCTSCLRDASPRPSWPVDGTCLAQDPALAKPSPRRERDATS